MSETTPRRNLARRALPGMLTASAFAVLALYLWDRRAYIADHFAFDPGTMAAIAALMVATL